MADLVTTTVQQMAEHMRRRAAKRAEKSRQRAAALACHLEAARDRLLELGASRVILFGSLAAGTAHEASDVDLAVAGLPAEVYFTALGELMTLFCAPVDLVRIEEACPSLADRIAAEGQQL
jgi:predicted nucleotidyltransferase